MGSVPGLSAPNPRAALSDQAPRVDHSIPASFSAGPSSTRCSFALLRNPDLTPGAWPETREGSNWARFSRHDGRRAALSLLAGEGIADRHVRRRHCQSSQLHRRPTRTKYVAGQEVDEHGAATFDPVALRSWVGSCCDARYPSVVQRCRIIILLGRPRQARESDAAATTIRVRSASSTLAWSTLEGTVNLSELIGSS